MHLCAHFIDAHFNFNSKIMSRKKNQQQQPLKLSIFYKKNVINDQIESIQYTYAH